MRVFLAGATGVIGRQLLPLLLAAGHEVAGMTRSPDRLADAPSGIVVVAEPEADPPAL